MHFSNNCRDSSTFHIISRCCERRHQGCTMIVSVTKTPQKPIFQPHVSFLGLYSCHVNLTPAATQCSTPATSSPPWVLVAASQDEACARRWVRWEGQRQRVPSTSCKLPGSQSNWRHSSLDMVTHQFFMTIFCCWTLLGFPPQNKKRVLRVKSWEIESSESKLNSGTHQKWPLRSIFYEHFLEPPKIAAEAARNKRVQSSWGEEAWGSAREVWESRRYF